MTYIDYMNQFWRLAAYESFAASEVALYAFLVNECNKFHCCLLYTSDAADD